jgi:hypothetical protein
LRFTKITVVHKEIAREEIWREGGRRNVSGVRLGEGRRMNWISVKGIL